MKDDYTKSKGYAKGWKAGEWFYRNEHTVYYTFCTVATVISVICGNVCSTMLGCTMLICCHLRKL